jgi:hypothetical protein
MNRALSNRNNNTPQIRSVRALTPSDLEILRRPAAISTIKSIRDSHHTIAWLLALGKTDIDVAREVGISVTRVSQLKQDPTFRELLATYRADISLARREHVDALASLATSNMLKAERQIADTLDEADAEGKVIPLRDLTRITADRMDRFGYGKHSSSTNINVGFAAKLEAAISRSRRAEE